MNEVLNIAIHKSRINMSQASRSVVSRLGDGER